MMYILIRIYDLSLDLSISRKKVPIANYALAGTIHLMLNNQRLLQEVALNGKNILVKADSATKAEVFYCPDCKGVMILRKGQVRIAHFAHKTLTPNCNPETVLHKVGKEKIKETIQLSIKDGGGIQINHSCSECWDIHRYNLLDGVTSVELEKQLGNVRPDISLLDTNGKTKTVIEVVVTHAPEESALAAFKEFGVIYIRVNLRDYSDLNFIKEKLSYPINYNKFNCKDLPNTVEVLPEPEYPSHMFIFNYCCNQCGEDTKIALIDVQENFFEITQPDEFSETELALARKEGVVIGSHKFSRNGDTYIVNKCSHCGRYPSTASRSVTLDNFYCTYAKNPEGTKIIELKVKK